MLHGSMGTKDAIRAVGEILEAEGQCYAIVVVGGSALNLLGIVNRATRDVDVIAIGHPPNVAVPGLKEPPEQLPEGLARAATLVARDLGLDSKRMNTGPALQWKQGLPPGFESRVQWRKYGNLNVGVVGRRDLVFFKLYAAADSIGPASVHYQDLLALQPTEEEVRAARDWTKTQVVSPDFHKVVDQVGEHVRRDTQTDSR